MKTLTTTLLFWTLIIVSQLTAQPCLPGGITFTTQQEIDDFPINYPDCTEIGGIVEISYNSSIEDLEGLSAIEKIDGNLLVFSTEALTDFSGLNSLGTINGDFSIGGNTVLENFNGLQNLDSIMGSFLVGGNPAIQSFEGLDQLSYIDGFMDVSFNSALESLSGLPNLSHLGERCNDYGKSCFSLFIFDNNNLSDLSGFQNLTYLPGNLEINNNDALTSFQGFHNMDSLDGSLTIWGNSAIFNMEGFNSLRHIEEACWIYYNESLENFEGLNRLEYIGGYEFNYPNPYSAKLGFSVYSNASLIDFTGLDSLRVIGTGALRIVENQNLTSLNGLGGLENVGYHFGYSANVVITSNPELETLVGLGDLITSSVPIFILHNNPMLSVCNIPPICAYLSVEGATSLYNNATGCNTPLQIEEACESTAVQEVPSELKDVLISPNPNDGVLQIHNLPYEPTEIYIRDGRGILVFHQKEFANGPVDLSALPTGIYFLEARIPTGFVTQIFIRQ